MLKNLNINEDICKIVLLHHGASKLIYNEDIRKDIIEHVSIDDKTRFCSEIIMAADIYTALTSDRVYSKARSFNEAIDCIRNESKVDYRIVDALIRECQARKCS